MVFEHVIKFSEVKKSGPTVNFFSLPPKNQACNLLYVYGHMYIIITSRESRGRNGLAWERKKVGRGGTTRASSSCVWEEKRWQRGRASSSKTMSAGVLLLVFFFWLGQFRSPFSLGPRESSAKSVERMQRMHCLGTPSIGRQFHFCVGFEGKGSGENADASFSLSNSLSL